MKKKERSLNQLRQTKDAVYTVPKVESKKIFDTETVVDLIKKYPNDYALGEAIRSFYLNNR